MEPGHDPLLGCVLAMMKFVVFFVVILFFAAGVLVGIIVPEVFKLLA